jgi:hypothetical protein
MTSLPPSWRATRERATLEVFLVNQERPALEEQKMPFSVNARSFPEKGRRSMKRP